MAHHEPALRQSLQEHAEQVCEVGLPRKIIGAGEGRIEGDAAPCGALAQAHTQHVERERFQVGRRPFRFRHAAALPDPGLWRSVADRSEECVAHLRKGLHMLVAVDIVGRTAEHPLEGSKLR